MKILLIVAIIAIIIFIFNSSREYMTNEKLIAGLQKQSGVGSGAPTGGSAGSLPLYGPSAINPPVPTPSSSGSGSGSGKTSASYPDIYGPNVPSVPGRAGAGAGAGVGNQVSGLDSHQEGTDSSTFVYNPNLRKAFPTADGEPKPFLTDLHKIQH